MGDQLVLVDCGAGALHRLVEAGYTGSGIQRIAITHLHSDHITGLADLLWAGWLQHWWTTPPAVVGPPGTAAFVHNLIEAFSYDIRVRTVDGGLTREGLEPAVEEIEDGWTVEGDHWRLTGFRVEHEPVDQAFGYRLDADAGSIVVSGDTRRSENLIRYAHDVDLLIHEIVWRRGMDRLIASTPEPGQRGRWERVLNYHTASDELGEVAARAGAKHLVLSHLIFAGGTPDDLRADVRRTFGGELTVGEDLATVAVD